ncbi:sugar ABC transporter permease [Spirochaetia bacterium]|nr:sugar ABC transporter permease [Spirochaetia bacterium]
MNRKLLRSRRTSAGDVVNIAILLLFAFVCIYPFWYIFIATISNPNTFSRSSLLLPHNLTLFNYREVLQSRGIPQAVLISVLRTILGTALTVFCNTFLAYLFTQGRLPWRRFFYRMTIITMYVSGGLIPTFFVFRAYGLTNNFLVYIIPGAISAFNVVLVRTYIENSIPASLEESARIDGCGPLRLFASIIFPLCLPITATIALFSAVGQWNAWFDNMIYTSRVSGLTTLQFILYQKLNDANAIVAAARSGNIQTLEQLLSRQTLTPDSIRMTITMIVTLPILLVYPFLQKYFVKGIMIGAIKG